MSRVAFALRLVGVSSAAFRRAFASLASLISITCLLLTDGFVVPGTILEARSRSAELVRSGRRRRAATTSNSFSRNEVLAQRLSDGLGSVPSAELGLRFLQMTANCLLAETQVSTDLSRLHPRRNEPQDRQFPWGQATVYSDDVRIRLDQLIQT